MLVCRGWLIYIMGSSRGALGASNFTRQSISWLFPTTWRSTMFRHGVQISAWNIHYAIILKILFIDRFETSTLCQGGSTLDILAKRNLGPRCGLRRIW